jgi:hypothetical protein
MAKQYTDKGVSDLILFPPVSEWGTWELQKSVKTIGSTAIKLVITHTQVRTLQN